MFSQYFNQGFYVYVLGIPVLVLLCTLSLRYFTLTYEPTLDEMKQFFSQSNLRVITSIIDIEKIHKYFSNRYDLPLKGVTQTRFSLILFAILIEVAILQTLLDFTNLDQKVLPTIFWSALYLVSLVFCWRFGSRLKNYVSQIKG